MNKLQSHKKFSISSMTKLYLQTIDNFESLIVRFNNMDDEKISEIKIHENLKIEELSLTANQLKSEMLKNKMKWISKNPLNSKNETEGTIFFYLTFEIFINVEESSKKQKFKLKQLEIKTFRVFLK